MGRPRKESQMEMQTPSKQYKVLGNDAVLTVEVETAQGKETRSYRVQGFLGNTLAWQRTGKGLDDILIDGLRKAFGGQVTSE